MSVKSIEATVVTLRARGVPIVTEPFVLPTISRKLAFFADPFGNLIELAEVPLSGAARMKKAVTCWDGMDRLVCYNVQSIDQTPAPRLE